MRQISRLAIGLMVTSALPAFAVEPSDVVATYQAIGAATFGDAHLTAQSLQTAVAALIAAPSDATLTAARNAWIAARVPYQQSEVFRFGNPVVDDWEGRINSWPLDEGLIDYVDASYGQSEENDLSRLNLVATPKFSIAGLAVDATNITPDLISGTLHEADGIEANVASGYHAVEFMLWGQDLNGTGPGAGARPSTDYVQGDGCTNANCDRRAAYLQAVTDLLVTDLAEMAADWQPGGAAAAVVDGDTQAAILAMLTGFGSLSYGELAGERMQLGLMLNDPEEEQDCFSDNTFNSHYNDLIGMQSLYSGHYTRVDGSVVEGPSLATLLHQVAPDVETALASHLSATVAAVSALKAAGDGGMAYDQMLAPGNAEGEALITAVIDGLVAQTADIQRAVEAFGMQSVEFEGSDSLDNPDAVFQ